MVAYVVNPGKFFPGKLLNNEWIFQNILHFSPKIGGKVLFYGFFQSCKVGENGL